MGKITNVVLNSNNAVSGASNQATFFIDWGAILDDRKAYRLHWTYVGGGNTFSAATKVPQVQVDFQTRQYLNRNSIMGAPTTTTIGALRFNATAVIAYLFADDNNNPPVYLDSRPYNNNFTVSIYNTDATPTLWKDTNAVPANPAAWIMTLSFQEIDEYEED